MIESNWGRCRGMRVAVLVLVAALAGGCGQKAANIEQLLADAKQERAKGNHAAAIIGFKNVVQKAPEHPEARYLLGMAYIDSGDYASAEKELRRALDLHYDAAKVVAPLGKALLALGEFQKVIDLTQAESGAGGGEQAEILALRGLASIALRREKEGRGLLEQALARQPDLPDALLGLARLAASEKKFDEATRLIERVIATAPGNTEAWMMKGDLDRALRRGDPVADYSKVIELQPDNLQAILNLISLHVAAGKYDEADRLMAVARKVAPRSPMVKYSQALIDFRKKNYPAARDAVLEVLKVAPNHLPSILLAGTVEYALGSHAQAQSYLARIVERVPGNLYARKLLVSSLAKTGQTQRALEVLGPGLAQAPGDAGLLGMAGELALQANELGKAREYFEKAAKLDPNSAGARTGLAVSRIASGDADAGLADLEAAVSLDSGKYQADILLVTSHLQSARYDQALKAAQSLEKKQPNNPLTYNLKAAAYLGKKDVKGARKELERALELQPTYLPAALNLAQLDLQDKNPQAARGRLEAILEKDKDNVQALLGLANLGPRIGATPKEQVAWLERAVRASPATVQPKLTLARFHAQARDWKKALAVAQEAAAASPDNPEVLDTLGAIQVGAGEKNQAVATYGKLVAMQPKSPVAHFHLAVAQSANGDGKAAGESLRKALALKPDFIEAQVALAELELRAGRHAEALAIAQQLQKRAPKSPLGHSLEGDALMVEKKFPQAAKSYETAYALGASGALAIKLHMALTQAGRPGEADARLAQWLKAAPEDATARFYAADAALKARQYKPAIEQYEWLQQKQPDNIVILNNLAWAYQQVGDKRALETAERAYKLKPDNPAVADTLGWMLVEQGNATRGIDLLQKAVAGAPKEPAIRYHLAQAWLKGGDKAKALNELERLLTADAKFPEQAEALALFKQLRSQNK